MYMYIINAGEKSTWRKVAGKKIVYGKESAPNKFTREKTRGKKSTGKSTHLLGRPQRIKLKTS